jgi:Flp pilus assembly protein TadG
MKSLCRSMAQLIRCTSGSALVEMTIVVPVAIALMAGAVDFGMAFSTQASLGKAARDAARYLAGLPTGAYCQNWAVTNAKSLVANIIPSATASVDCSPPNCPQNPPNQKCVTVTATFPYKSLILAGFLPIASQYILSAQHEEIQVGG